jgi:class 3 adenylate cyclase/tetratricopeptide (TPR) repeat protein
MTCPRCGSIPPDAARFCGQCGARLHPVAPGMPSAEDIASQTIRLDDSADESAVGEERKLITAMIADIKDSVKIVARLDPEQSQQIIHSVLGIMVESVVKFEGYVLQTLGDGIFAMFGVPVAYHDHAQRAVHAALHMQNALRAYARNVSDGGPRIEVRVGIESGEVVLRRLDMGRGPAYITLGYTVNLAARLQSVSPPGSISIGEQTKRLVESYFDLTALPSVSLKGLTDPVRIYEVTGLGRLRQHSQICARREFSKFVNRTDEFVQLRRALERAMAKQGQLVSMVTDAGTGKSRLVLEFSRTLPPGCKIIETYAVSHGRKIPWDPVIRMLGEYFGILEFDDPSARRNKITAALAGLEPEIPVVQALLFRLLGIVDGPDPQLDQMDPGVRRNRTVDAIIHILATESARQPVILIFEDLHWIDAQTRFLLSRLVERIASERILVLATYRPEYERDWPVADHVTEIRLDPLDMDSSEALVSALLGKDPEISKLKQLIVERAGGNPFFLEEIVNALSEDGTLSREGTAKLTKPLAELQMPMTVRGLLAERIDQTAPRSKEMLQILSVIGHRLPMALILEVSPWPIAETEKIMSDLQAADFIYAQTAIQGDKNQLDYAFKHVLTQEVAYQSILGQRRQSLHRRVGQAIELIYAANPNDHITSLAHHFSRAVDHRKAIEYLGKAGQQGIQRSAHQDAIKSIRDALGRIPMLPEDTVDPAQVASLWSALGISLQMTSGYASDEVGFAFARAQEMSAKARDDLGLAVTLRGIYLFNIVRAEYRKALQAGHDLIALGGGNSSYTQEGYVCLGLTLEYLGEFKSSDEAFVRAVSLESASDFVDRVQYSGNSRTLSRSYYALCLAHLGQFGRALALSRQALALAEQLSLPITTAQSLGVHAIILHKLRAYATSRLYYDEAIAWASRHGFPYWLTLASTLKTSLPMGRGDTASKLPDFEHNLAGLRATGTRLGMSWYLALRAELLAAAGRFDEALASIDEAVAFVADTGERLNEANAHRVKGAIVLAKSNHAGGDGLAEAEASFATSLSIASRQQAKLWELRAAISLACVRAHQGRFEEGLELLSPVYASFTEAVAMPDLVDALRLLQYLGRSGAGAVPLSDVAGSALLAR